MDWNQTRKKLLQLTTGRNGRPGALERPSASPEGRESHSWTSDPRLDPIRPSLPDTDRRLGRAVRARSLCIASGKGGTGKSVVTAALAALFSPRGRTLILDADRRDGVAASLRDQGIPTGVYYARPLHQQTAYREFHDRTVDLSVAEDLAGRVLSLPMHAYLEPSLQDRIVDAVRMSL